MDLISFYIQSANIFEMRKYLGFVCFLAVFTCQARVKNFSVHIGASLPVLPGNETTDELIAIPIAAASGYSYVTSSVSLKESFAERRGFEMRGQFDYKITSKLYMTCGLSLHYVQFRRTMQVTRISGAFETITILPPNVITGTPFGTIFSGSDRDSNGNIIVNPGLTLEQPKNLGSTTAFSMQLPILVGTSILNNKLQVRTGPVFSYLLRSTEVRQTYSNGVISEYKDSSKDSFNEFQAGVALQTAYLVSPRIGIDLGAQKFFTSIYKSSELAGGSTRYNFVSLGLCYNFL